MKPTTGDAGSSPNPAAGPPDRISVRGKFLFAGDSKFWTKGIRYTLPENAGPRTDAVGPGTVGQDFDRFAAAGINTLWMKGAPPAEILDRAAASGLRLVLMPESWQAARALNSRHGMRGAERALADAVRAARAHPAVLAHVLASGFPEDVVRWHGTRRIEAFVARLCATAKSIDPDCLVTCLNRPDTAHLRLPLLDFFSFDLTGQDGATQLRSEVERLHNLIGDKPLLACHAPDTIDDGRGPSTDAVLTARVRDSFESGVAGVCIGTVPARSHPAQDDRARPVRTRPSLASACHAAFARAPFAQDIAWPRVSIVVCSYNGAGTIRDTLEGIRALEYPNFEAIVINDGSTDATPTIAGEYDVKLISTENRGLSNARNTGWQTADGDIVAYIDDDAYPDPHWLHYLALSFLRSDFVGVGGPNIAPPGDGKVADCVANAPGGPVHVLLTDTEAEHIPGCNMSFRREALAAIDGFDARYRAAGDDVDLCWRLQERGGRIGFNAAAVVWHHRRNSVRTYWKQQQGYGKAEALLVAKWPERYNVLGHYAWSGRLYGKGLTQPLRLYATGVYGGRPVAAAVQSIHVGEAGLLATLPLMPEWYVIVAALGLLALLGLSWPPLLWFAPAAVIALALPLGQAMLSAARAEFPTRHDSGLMRARLRILTALLHLMQPLARLKGRLQHGLTPWRSSARGRPTWRPTDTRTVVVGGTQRVSGMRDTLSQLARQRSIPIERGEAADDWDVEIIGGALGSARAVIASLPATEAGTLSIRIRSRLSPAVLAATASGLVASAVAVQQGAWVAAAVIGAGALGLTVTACIQAGSAHRVLRELVDSLGTLQVADAPHPANETGG